MIIMSDPSLEVTGLYSKNLEKEVSQKALQIPRPNLK
jgi:hypothetical protein